MAAGLGFKTFAVGEVLSAANVNGYLMQGVLVFANATARDAAITSPEEGQFAYLKDTNVTTYYTGSAWANLDTTGMTNPMTTTGDTIYSSSGSTPARLGLGTAGQVLQVNSGATAPEWATPAAGGGMTLINTGGTTLSGSSIQVASIPSTYNYLYCEIVGFRPATNATDIRMTFNNDSNVKYGWSGGSTFNQPSAKLTDGGASSSSSNALISFNIPAYTNTTTWKFAWAQALAPTSANTANYFLTNYMALYNGTSAISSIELVPSAGNFTSGTFYVWGVK